MKFIFPMFAFLTITSQAFAEVRIDMTAIKHIESRGNPLAFNKSSKARGLYQITPIVLLEFNNFNKTEYRDLDLFIPMVNEKIAFWYMNKRIPQMFRHFKVKDSVRNRIIAWNAGIVHARNGFAPKETRGFLKKYERLTNGRQQVD